MQEHTKQTGCLGCKYDGYTNKVKTLCMHPLSGETSFWRNEDGTAKVHTDDCYERGAEFDDSDADNGLHF